MANKTVPGVVNIALVGFAAAGVSEIDLATITFDLTPGSPGNSTVLAFLPNSSLRLQWDKLFI